MKSVEILQDQQDQAARAALEALEQAYAYYAPEPQPAAQEPECDEFVFGYSQAA